MPLQDRSTPSMTSQLRLVQLLHQWWHLRSFIPSFFFITLIPQILAILEMQTLTLSACEISNKLRRDRRTCLRDIPNHPDQTSQNLCFWMNKSSQVIIIHTPHWKNINLKFYLHRAWTSLLTNKQLWSVWLDHILKHATCRYKKQHSNKQLDIRTHTKIWLMIHKPSILQLFSGFPLALCT